MTDYSYTAKSTNGENIDGTISAHSLQSARDAIVELGLEPIEIYETPASMQPVHEPLKDAPQPAPAVEVSGRVYFPLFETLRLYAGWLLAWYSLVYAIGSYQFMKDVPMRIPYAESLFLSPLVLSFTFAAYLFLLLSGFYARFGRKKRVAVVLLVVGIALFVLYRINVE